MNINPKCAISIAMSFIRIELSDLAHWIAGVLYSANNGLTCARIRDQARADGIETTGRQVAVELATLERAGVVRRQGRHWRSSD